MTEQVRNFFEREREIENGKAEWKNGETHTTARCGADVRSARTEETKGDCVMTEWASNFSERDIENGALLLGDRDETRNTVRCVMDMWKVADKLEPVVVLDFDGSLYERSGGKGLLVDFSSIGSYVPDFYTPLLRHGCYEESPRASAELIVDLIMTDKQSKGSNDEFWTQSARQLMAEYSEYGLILAGLDAINKGGENNFALRFAGAHGFLYSLMRNIVSKREKETVRWGDISNSLREWQVGSLTEFEKNFSNELREQHSGDAIPFSETLALYTKSSSGNTAGCVFGTAVAFGGAFWQFNNKIAKKADIYDKFKSLDLRAFIDGECGEDGKILFVAGGADRKFSSILALMTLMGCCAAADSANKRFACLISDIAAWDIFGGLCKLKDNFPNSFRLITGVEDFARGARLTDISAEDWIDKLAELTGQNVIWHKSDSGFIKKLFKHRTAAMNLMYDVSVLGGDGLAAIERGGEIQYEYIPRAVDSDGAPAVRKPATRSGSSAGSWFEKMKARLEAEALEREKTAALKCKIFEKMQALTEDDETKDDEGGEEDGDSDGDLWTGDDDDDDDDD